MTIHENNTTNQPAPLTQAPPMPPELTRFCTENIPQELKLLRQWLMWQPHWTVDKKGNGKWSKVPYSVHGGKAASTRPHTWSSFQDTVKEAQRSDGLFGIGFALVKDGGIIGIDLDHCVNPDTGEIDKWAGDIIAMMNTYTEISPSGTGVRMFIRGVKPGPRSKTGNIETYEWGRFLTLTGNRVPGTPNRIEHRSAALYTLYCETWGVPPDPESKKTESQPLQKPVSAFAMSLDDAEIIERAKKARNGKKFSDLWEGIWQGWFSSQSEADGSLCSLLWWWVGDFNRVDNLFRQSALFRESKWGERPEIRQYMAEWLSDKPWIGTSSKTNTASKSSQDLPSETAPDTLLVNSIEYTNSVSSPENADVKALIRESGVLPRPEEIDTDLESPPEYLSLDYYRWLNQKIREERDLPASDSPGAPFFPLDDQEQLRRRAKEFMGEEIGFPDGKYAACINRSNPIHGKAYFGLSPSWKSPVNASVHRREKFCHWFPIFRSHLVSGGEFYRAEIPLQKVEIGEDPTKKIIGNLRTKIGQRKRGLVRWFSCPEWRVIVVYSTVDPGEVKGVSPFELLASGAEGVAEIELDLLNTLEMTDNPSFDRCGNYTFKGIANGSREWNEHTTHNGEWEMVGSRALIIDDAESLKANEEYDLMISAQNEVMVREASDMEIAHISPGAVISAKHYEVSEAVGAKRNKENPIAGGYWLLLKNFRDMGFLLTQKAFDDYVRRTMSIGVKKADKGKEASEDAKAQVA